MRMNGCSQFTRSSCVHVPLVFGPMLRDSMHVNMVLHVENRTVDRPQVVC